MKTLVLGSGAREHAIAWKLSRSPIVERVFVGPGNAGTAETGENLPGVDPLRFDTIVDACEATGASLVFVGPEAPLATGVVDFLAEHGVAAIGPGKKSAELESSKAFSKLFLVRNGIPTARATEVCSTAELKARLRGWEGRRMVIKKSGLASGKGVLESSDTEALLAFGRSILEDDRLLLEEFLEGWEVSVFGLSDGRSFVILPPCTDFKKAHDGDTGPNTGGMGSICPVPWADSALMERVSREIVAPTYAAMAREGLSYAGVLYFGLMITREGPKVLEFNVRFGDPETQVLLPVLNFDLGELVQAMASGTLAQYSMKTHGTNSAPGSWGVHDTFTRARFSALGVVAASPGYPAGSTKGIPVSPIPVLPPDQALVFHASTTRGSDGRIRTGGGRCFTAVGLGNDLHAASENAYAAVEKIRFEGGWYRRDIGRKFLAGAGADARGGTS